MFWQSATLKFWLPCILEHGDRSRKEIERNICCAKPFQKLMYVSPPVAGSCLLDSWQTRNIICGGNITRKPHFRNMKNMSRPKCSILLGLDSSQWNYILARSDEEKGGHKYQPGIFRTHSNQRLWLGLVGKSWWRGGWHIGPSLNEGGPHTAIWLMPSLKLPGQEQRKDRGRESLWSSVLISLRISFEAADSDISAKA